MFMPNTSAFRPILNRVFRRNLGGVRQAFTDSRLNFLLRLQSWNLSSLSLNSLSSVTAMALPFAFQERLQQMEETRNQRLSLLQAEKELQSKKSSLLSSKFSNIRIMEQRCLMLDHINATLRFKILAYKSEIESIEARYQNAAHQFKGLKIEVEELEDLEEDKEKFYEMKSCEMKEFRVRVERSILESQMQVQEMRKRIAELKSSIEEFQANNGCFNNSEIAAAEARKAELLLVKENLDRNLASNYRLRTQLQKQLYNILISQDQERRKLIQRN